MRVPLEVSCIATNFHWELFSPTWYFLMTQSHFVLVIFVWMWEFIEIKRGRIRNSHPNIHSREGPSQNKTQILWHLSLTLLFRVQTTSSSLTAASAKKVSTSTAAHITDEFWRISLGSQSPWREAAIFPEQQYWMEHLYWQENCSDCQCHYPQLHLPIKGCW